MKETGPDLIDELRREELARLRVRPLPPLEVPALAATELPEDTSGGLLAQEWNFYRREVARLLAEGHAGRWALVKGTSVVGIWDTEEEADRVRLQRFLQEAVLMKQILVREPILRGGHLWRWHS